MTQRYDFANILFAGPCNLHCPFCIGQHVDPALNQNNLNQFPLRNLDRFVTLLKRYQVTEIVLTGTTTDPQLYRYEAQLLEWLRTRLPPVRKAGSASDVRYALHTNGQLAMRKMDVLNCYDRVCISFPSFNPDTYRRMMGSRRVPDLAEIVQRARVPVKLSCVINEHNVREVAEFLAQCKAIGIKRLVFRQLYGDTRRWDILGDLPQTSVYCRNPVYDYDGMEVTYWNFHRTNSRSLNLFSDGTISPDYLLAKAASKKTER